MRRSRDVMRIPGLHDREICHRRAPHHGVAEEARPGSLLFTHDPAAGQAVGDEGMFCGLTVTPAATWKGGTRKNMSSAARGEYQNTKWHRKSLFFLQKVPITVDASNCHGNQYFLQSARNEKSGDGQATPFSPRHLLLTRKFHSRYVTSFLRKEIHLLFSPATFLHGYDDFLSITWETY